MFHRLPLAVRSSVARPVPPVRLTAARQARTVIAAHPPAPPRRESRRRLQGSGPGSQLSQLPGPPGAGRRCLPPAPPSRRSPPRGRRRGPPGTWWGRWLGRRWAGRPSPGRTRPGWTGPLPPAARARWGGIHRGTGAGSGTVRAAAGPACSSQLIRQTGRQCSVGCIDCQPVAAWDNRSRGPRIALIGGWSYHHPNPILIGERKPYQNTHNSPFCSSAKSTR